MHQERRAGSPHPGGRPGPPGCTAAGASHLWVVTVGGVGRCHLARAPEHLSAAPSPLRTSGQRTGWTCSREGALVGRLPCGLLKPLSPCGMLEGQASQGFLGHLHGSGAWPVAPGTEHQGPAARVEACGSDLPQEALQLPLVCQGPEASPDRREGHGSPPRRGGTGAMTPRAVCLGRGCHVVSAQQTRSSQVRSLTRWNTGFGSAPRLPSRAGCREEVGAGVTVAHGEELVTRGSGVPLPRGPESKGRLCGVRAGNRAPSVSSRGPWLPGGPSLAPPVLRACHRSSLASPPECREEPRRAFLHLL